MERTCLRLVVELVDTVERQVIVVVEGDVPFTEVDAALGLKRQPTVLVSVLEHNDATDGILVAADLDPNVHRIVAVHEGPLQLQMSVSQVLELAKAMLQGAGHLPEMVDTDGGAEPDRIFIQRAFHFSFPLWKRNRLIATPTTPLVDLLTKIVHEMYYFVKRILLIDPLRIPPHHHTRHPRRGLRLL